MASISNPTSFPSLLASQLSLSAGATESTLLTTAGATESAIPKKHIAAIEKIFGKDEVGKLLAETKPLEADCLAFRGEEILKKSFYELKSGRVVELLTFKDESVRCIGSFTFTPKESTIEGWAGYNEMTDKDRDVLSSKVEGGEDDKSGDWSCGWNTLQNLFYIKTGMKVTVPELMFCFVQVAKSKSGKILEVLTAAKKAGVNFTAPSEELEKVMREIGFDLSAITFFLSSDEICRFAGGDGAEGFLIGSKRKYTDPEMEENYLSPKDLVQAIQKHDFIKHGPLTLASGIEGTLLFADERGQFIMIDPHNYKRSSNYYAQRILKKVELKRDSFTLEMQDATGKIHRYPNSACVNGLTCDVNVEMTGKILSEIRSQEPLTVDLLAKEISGLIADAKKFDKFFSDPSSEG